MPRRLHAQLARAAKPEGVSLNQYIVYLLSSASGSRMPEQPGGLSEPLRRPSRNARGLLVSLPPAPPPLQLRQQPRQLALLGLGEPRRHAPPRRRGPSRARPGTAARPTPRDRARGSAGRSPAPRAATRPRFSRRTITGLMVDLSTPNAAGQRHLRDAGIGAGSGSARRTSPA